MADPTAGIGGVHGAPPELDLALAICAEADAISLRLFHAGTSARRKQDRTFVTDADLHIERLAREHIAATYPGHGIVGEEFGGADDDSIPVPRWFIDPIDATHNFMRGIPIFATLLALEDSGGMAVAAVSAPALGARWYAWRDGGAWRRSTFRGELLHDEAPRRLRVSSIDRLADAQLVTSGTELLDEPSLPGLAATFRRAFRERGFGDFWGYVLVAEGAAEAMIEVGMHAWDIAPMALLLSEAGGRLTDLHGDPTIHGKGALASNGLLHEELLSALRPA